jgi:hypothetical protein
MATKKGKAEGGAKKYSSKKSAAKKSSAKKSTAKSLTKKSTSQKSGSKKSFAKSAAKKSAKKGALKGASKKAGTETSMLSTTGTATEAICTLTAPATTLLVSRCAPQAANIGSTLSQAGIDTPNQRTAFRDCVFQAVLAAGCVINRSDIPNSRDTTLRQVVFAILDAI